MGKKTREILVGDLLVKAGVIERRVLADALPISLKTALPVGRILISDGSLKEQTLQAALFAQSLVRDCLLTEELAAQALGMLHGQQITLEEALSRLGWRSESYELTNRLGQLFLDAGIITEEELATGLEGFYTAGLPLARVLVIQGVINNNIAFSALTAQKLVRDGLISREQAIEALRSAAANETTIEESLSIHGYLQLYPQNTIRLGELLVLAGITTEAELLENVERSLNYEEYIGETFVNTGQIPKHLLEAALELQKLSTRNMLDPREAAEALRRIEATNMSVEDAVREIKAPPEIRAELLGLISEEEAKLAAARESEMALGHLDDENSAPASGGESPKKEGSADLYLALLKDAIMNGDISSSPQVRQQLLGLVDSSTPGSDNEDDGEFETVSGQISLDFLVGDRDIRQEQPKQSNARISSQGQAGALNDSRTDSLADYLNALKQTVTREVRKRKQKREKNDKASRRARLNKADSALLAMAELQMSSTTNGGSNGNIRQQAKLINKLIERIEQLSFRAGYLEGCIATSNDELELDHQLNETANHSDHKTNGSRESSHNNSAKDQLFKKQMLLSADREKRKADAKRNR